MSSLATLRESRTLYAGRLARGKFSGKSPTRPFFLPRMRTSPSSEVVRSAAGPMPKIKVPSSDQEEPQAGPARKRHVRLKNAFPPKAKERRLVARAKKLARRMLSAPKKTPLSFEEAFGASDDEVGESLSPPAALRGSGWRRGDVSDGRCVENPP